MPRLGPAIGTAPPFIGAADIAIQAVDIDRIGCALVLAIHVAGDDTFAKLLAGQSPRFREGYGELLAGEGFPISNPKPYIKLHFPKTYAMLYVR